MNVATDLRLDRRSIFFLLVMLFFMWGFITSLNDILIPHLKSVFNLNYTQAMLVQFCFFGAYFIMSVPAGRIIERLGYAKGIVTGLIMMGVGCLFFIPASSIPSYGLFLFGLFVLASGITVLQVAANPFVAAVGDPERASSRLNLSQGFNSLAHTIAPIFGTYLILADESAGENITAEAVQLPYVGIAVVLFLMAIFFLFKKIPTIQHEAEGDENNQSVWTKPHLVLGVIAIFLYVGIEVSIGGFIVNFLGEEDIAGLPEKSAGNFVSYYWGGAMVGRFIGSAILQRIKAQNLLAISAAGAFILIAITVSGSGLLAMWSVLLIGFFNSVMFPNIFTLAIKGLGKQTSRGSGLLVMAIVGGAIIPIVQGAMADAFGVQFSFVIGFVCYGYVIYYALSGYRIR